MNFEDLSALKIEIWAIPLDKKWHHNTLNLTPESKAPIPSTINKTAQQKFQTK
jgi:hypothetical protein